MRATHYQHKIKAIEGDLWDLSTNLFECESSIWQKLILNAFCRIFDCKRLFEASLVVERPRTFLSRTLAGGFWNDTTGTK